MKIFEKLATHIKSFFNGLKMMYFAVPIEARTVCLIIVMYLMLKYKIGIMGLIERMIRVVLDGSKEFAGNVLSKTFDISVIDKDKLKERILRVESEAIAEGRRQEQKKMAKKE